MTREETLCEILRAVISAEPHNEGAAIAATKSFKAAMAEWDGKAIAPSDMTGQALQTLRKRAGYSQSSLGKKVGVSPQAVQKWEAGESHPRGKRLASLRQALAIA